MDRKQLLEQALSSPDPEVRAAATAALREETQGVAAGPGGGAFVALVKLLATKAIESGAAEAILKLALEWLARGKPAPA